MGEGGRSRISFFCSEVAGRLTWRNEAMGVLKNIMLVAETGIFVFRNIRHHFFPDATQTGIHISQEK